MFEKITEELKEHKVSFKSNDTIYKYITHERKEELEKEVTVAAENLLRTLLIDVDNDHNAQDTAHRVAKMFLNEIYAGRYNAPPKITTFPNVTDYDQIYVTGPITVRSMCAHHMMPIVGKCYIGVYPGNHVIGLSKFNRLVDWICSRPQIQEEMTQQIADVVEEFTQADGVAVLVKAEHFCMTHRGIKEHASDMTTSVMRGVFTEEPSLKKEFYDIVKMMK